MPASWNDGASGSRIVRFVEDVTDPASRNFVPPAERIAVFDNDGTLWTEQPLYFQLAFVLDRIKQPAFAPMRELLVCLRANGFKTYIASGGGAEFVRAFSARVYGVPPQQVVGSTLRSTYELRDGRPVIEQLGTLDFINDKEGKPVGIEKQIGRRPILAPQQFGRSDLQAHVAPAAERREGAHGAERGDDSGEHLR